MASDGNGEKFEVLEPRLPVIPILSLRAMMMQRSTARRLAPRLGCVVGALVTFATGCHRYSPQEESEKLSSSEGVQFAAEASTPPDRSDTVFLVIKATNRSNGYRMVEIFPAGKCGPSVAFASGRGKATRVWRLESPPRQLPPGTMEGCVATALMVQLKPGASVENFHATVPVRAILGDSLLPGLYRGVIGGDAQLRGGYVTPEIALR